MRAPLAAAKLAACIITTITTITPAAHAVAKPRSEPAVNGAASAGQGRLASGAASAGQGKLASGTAFAGLGRLAFVSAGRLYILDGSVRGRPAQLRPVAAPAGVTGPAWSPDGRWLAFLIAAPGSYLDAADATGTLWLVRGDGAAARPVLRDAGQFSWSPAADTLAATVTGASGSGRLYEMRPGAAPRFRATVTGGAVWSPDGRWLAYDISHYGANGFTGAELRVIPADRGAARVRARSAQDAYLVDGWWPDGHGLLAWSDPDSSASIAADGLPLVSYPMPGGPAVTLGTTLVHRSFAAMAAGPAVALVTGDDRIVWHGKTITTCGEYSGCRSAALRGMPGPANLDPAWRLAPRAPLAFVHAAASVPLSSGFSQAALAAWYRTRSLWVTSAAGGPARQVRAAGTGVAAPAWAPDGGEMLMYVRDNGLWLINPRGGQPRQIVSSLFAGDWPQYFGYVDWAGQFAWHR